MRFWMMRGSRSGATRAVQMRGVLPDAVLGEAGRLSPEAIAEVREEIWPDIRDEHELHDLLCSLVVVPVEMLRTARVPGLGRFSGAAGADGASGDASDGRKWRILWQRSGRRG